MKENKRLMIFLESLVNTVVIFLIGLIMLPVSYYFYTGMFKLGLSKIPVENLTKTMDMSIRLNALKQVQSINFTNYIDLSFKTVLMLLTIAVFSVIFYMVWLKGTERLERNNLVLGGVNILLQFLFSIKGVVIYTTSLLIVGLNVIFMAPGFFIKLFAILYLLIYIAVIIGFLFIQLFAVGSIHSIFVDKLRDDTKIEKPTKSCDI